MASAVQPKTVQQQSSDTTAKKPFWTLSAEEQSKALGCTQDGLSASEAAERLKRFGDNADAKHRRVSPFRAILRRLLEPLSLILLAAGFVSIATGDATGGAIIVTILTFSVGLDTFQEGHAEQAAEVLRRSVALKAEVKRDGNIVPVPVEAVVPGDLIRVRAGDIIPADALVLTASACTVNEAALTGEPYPVEKKPGAVTGTTAAEAVNGLFRGAVLQTGEAVALVVGTGSATLFGAAATALVQAEAASPFQRDLRAYGLLTARLTLALVLVVLAVNISFGRPLLQSLLFAVALAVGLTPELCR